jgi:hypothetical protein
MRCGTMTVLQRHLDMIAVRWHQVRTGLWYNLLQQSALSQEVVASCITTTGLKADFWHCISASSQRQGWVCRYFLLVVNTSIVNDRVGNAMN